MRAPVVGLAYALTGRDQDGAVPVTRHSAPVVGLAYALTGRDQDGAVPVTRHSAR